MSRPHQSTASPPRQYRAWLLTLAVVLLLAVAACQQTGEESTPTLPPPPTGDNTLMPADGYPAPSVTSTPTAANYPAPATAYPVSTASSTPPTAEYPAPPTETPRNTHTPAATPVSLAQVYVPLVPRGAEPTATPTPTATNTPRPTPTPTPTIDFAAVRAELLAQGQDLGFAKIGFHTGVGGNRNGLGEWMRRLDEAGVPFFLKSVDDSGPLVEAQELVRAGDTPHTLVYRRSGNEYDTPNYDLPPQQAARLHWQLHKEAWPPELDPGIVWIETINEVDKGRSEWLASFALETARLTLADGFRWAAFGWSSGEPEDSDWQSPAMLEFLRLAGANPERLAIAVHEYSFLADEIAEAYPFKVGRFQRLFQITDQHGIPRPTLLITEWGWEYQDIPPVDQALRDIEWAAAMYAHFPEIKGAAIWYLGGGFSGIAEKVQPLIKPVLEFSLGNYFVIPLPPNEAPIAPESFRP